ncbi:MAG: AAA family ATPase, partial [Halobacteriaceae archaeon]
IGGHPIEDISPVTDVESLRRARATAADVTVESEVRDYVTRLVDFTRDHASLGASPRAGISLLQAAQGRAILEGRDYVIPDDIKDEARPVLVHRIRATPSSAIGDENAQEIVDKALSRISPN